MVNYISNIPSLESIINLLLFNRPNFKKKKKKTQKRKKKKVISVILYVKTKGTIKGHLFLFFIFLFMKKIVTLLGRR